MRFLRNRFAMGGLVIGSSLTLLLLFLQNSGVISLSVQFFAVIWWLLAWPFTLAALIVANSATGNAVSPEWGIPVLLGSIVLNLTYFYGMGALLGSMWTTWKGARS